MVVYVATSIYSSSIFAKLPQEFRDTHGEPTTHDPLRFRLQDFAMDDTAKEILGSDDAELHITMDQLCDFLSRAENKAEHRKIGKLRTKKTRTGKRKVPLEETPERDITTEDEKRWQQEERRAAKRANRGDGSYSYPYTLST
jgi:hypothetical protein